METEFRSRKKRLAHKGTKNGVSGTRHDSDMGEKSKSYASAIPTRRRHAMQPAVCGYAILCMHTLSSDRRLVISVHHKAMHRASREHRDTR